MRAATAFSNFANSLLRADSSCLKLLCFITYNVALSVMHAQVHITQ